MNDIPCIWKDKLVTVTGFLGKHDKTNYVSIKESPTGIPINELTVIDPQSPFIGLWVDPQGRLHHTE